jgi:hypothetical protein
LDGFHGERGADPGWTRHGRLEEGFGNHDAAARQKETTLFIAAR